jgi:hypothetical protein
VIYTPFFSGKGLARGRLFDEEVFYRALVPLEAGAPPFGIEGVTGFDPHGFLEDGYGEVEVLESVSRRGNGQKECLSPGRCGS